MSFIAFVAAAAMSMPEVLRKDLLYMYRAFPDWVRDVNDTTLLDIVMTTNRQGEVIDCDVITFVGDERTSRLLCNVWIGRRIRAARTLERKRTYAQLYTRIVFEGETPTDERMIELRAKQTNGPALKVPRNKLMVDGDIYVSADAMIAIDTSGRVTACHLRYEPMKAIEDSICELASSQTYDPLMDEDGAAVPYIRNIAIALEPDGS